MARKPTLIELQEKKAALEARIAQEQAKLRVRTRKEETRRKVLAGAAILYNAERDPVFKATVMKMVDEFLSRPDERAAFDLPARPKSRTSTPADNPIGEEASA